MDDKFLKPFLMQMDFNEVDESFIQSIASKRNNIPRKSLNYKTPIEVFLNHICKEELSNLILTINKIKKNKSTQNQYLKITLNLFDKMMSFEYNCVS